LAGLWCTDRNEFAIADFDVFHAVSCTRPSISSFNRTLGGTLFMALISSGPASAEPLWFGSPGGYQRLFALQEV
jgi:hypothetical protein